MLLLPSFVLVVTAAAAQGAPPLAAVQQANSASPIKRNSTSLTKTNVAISITNGGKRALYDILTSKTHTSYKFFFTFQTVDQFFCGHGRIINGVDASDRYLYMAAVFADGSTLCGGTFLSRSWVLTAAQCVVGFTMWEVWLGVTSLAGGDPGRITMVSATATANADYSGNNYDIAVINTIVVEAVYLAPAELPFRSDTPLSRVGDTAIMTGWGATAAGGPTQTTLKHANGSFAGECGAGYHVCVYTRGDYGGPLVVKGVAIGSWTVMGVAIGTDLSGNRSVFTNVHQNLDWIASVTDLPIYDSFDAVPVTAN